MSIKSQTDSGKASPPQAPENTASTFVEIPSCKIEDIDKALFNLFDKDLPLLYTHRNDTRRVPIVFATGERFALIARKKPLRDRSNALILPVISILRSNIQMSNEIGGSFAPDIPQIIKKQISAESSIYQRLVNDLDFKNANDLVSDDAFLDFSNKSGAKEGRIATRRQRSLNEEEKFKGNILSKNSVGNIYEIFEIPAPTYVTIDYEVTFWTQYMQEMNNLLSVLATETHFKATPSYRIETDKGYYFVAYLDKAVSNQSNFDDFSEEERHVRTSFNVKVVGYLLGSVYKGSPSNIKRYVSAPSVSFEAAIVDDAPVVENPVSVASGNPNDYIFDNLRSNDDPLPGQSIGSKSNLKVKDPEEFIGGHSSAAGEKFVRKIQNPFNSAKTDEVILVTKTRSNRKGETVLREIL